MFVISIRRFEVAVAVANDLVRNLKCLSQRFVFVTERQIAFAQGRDFLAKRDYLFV